ncbi:unnamed protein product [Orchesella dallaii]|uniref:Uncharacterized protein n=1 Tax=Orchesella dallaii TaxID=48710 RepID=A0ABP1R3M3_9HEXA
MMDSQQHPQHSDMEVVDIYSEDSDSEIAVVGIRISSEYRANPDLIGSRRVNRNRHRHIPSPEVAVIQRRNVYEPEVEIIEIIEEFQPVSPPLVPQRVLPAKNIDFIELSDDDDDTEIERMGSSISFSSETTELVTPKKELQHTDSLEVEDVETSDQPSRWYDDQDTSPIGGQEQKLVAEGSHIENNQHAINVNHYGSKSLTESLSASSSPPLITITAASKKRELAGPSKKQEGADPSKQQEGADPIKKQEGADPSKKQEGADPSKKQEGADPIKISESASSNNLPETAGPRITPKSSISSSKPENASQSKNQESVGTSWSPENAGPNKKAELNDTSTKSGTAHFNEPSFHRGLEDTISYLNSIDWSTLNLESASETESSEPDDDVKEFCAAFKKAEAEMLKQMEEQKRKKLESRKKKELAKERITEKEKDNKIPASELGTRRTRQSTSRLTRNSLAATEPTTATQSPSCSRNTSKSAKQLESNNYESASDDGDDIWDSDDAFQVT